MFQATYGVYAQGVDMTTATLPPGWEGVSEAERRSWLKRRREALRARRARTTRPLPVDAIARARADRETSG